MTHAINTLEISLETLLTNEPIRRAEGDIKQADADARGIAEIRQAIGVLRTADSGQILPGFPVTDAFPGMSSCTVTHSDPRKTEIEKQMDAGTYVPTPESEMVTRAEQEMRADEDKFPGEGFDGVFSEEFFIDQLTKSNVGCAPLSKFPGVKQEWRKPRNSFWGMKLARTLTYLTGLLIGSMNLSAAAFGNSESFRLVAGTMGMFLVVFSGIHYTKWHLRDDDSD